VLVPKFRIIAPLAFPLGTFVPLTVIVALAVVVGVTVIDVTEFATLAVYCLVVELNAEESVPDESWRFESVGLCGLGEPPPSPPPPPQPPKANIAIRITIMKNDILFLLIVI